ncbi:MAG: transposase [Anaerolineae bacterium]
MLNLLMNWRTTLWITVLVFLIAGSFLPQTGGLLLASWWTEQQEVGPARWRVTRRPVSCPRWWPRVQGLYRWGRVMVALALGLWLLQHLSSLSEAAGWAWLGLVFTGQVALDAGRQVLSGLMDIQVSVPVAPPDSHVEVTIDLEPILAELDDFSPTSEVSITARKALTARLERIRAECFQHPVGQAWLKQIDAEVQGVVKRVVEEALVQELNDYLGFERYERTDAAKPAHQHRSGTWGRSLRTVWGAVEVRVPKLRTGNKARPWQVLVRYERNFGPWLDLQLHLYRLGLSQQDLQEILHLGFGQVLSPKAVQHLTDVAQREMEAFRQARLADTPAVMIVDGVNVKVLLPTGTYRINQRGHRRQVKRRETRVFLAALGVWHDGHYRVLDFDMVDKETKVNWKQFFRSLVAKGLDTSQLQLVVSDGRPGLHTAIRAVFPKAVKHQRCIFHKLKNLADNLTYKNLTLNPDLPQREARKQAKETRARAILRDAAHIYAGSDMVAIEQRRVDFQRQWASLEPKAVRCFMNDFDLTLNYLRVPFPHQRLIRTTNLLERFFREFRSRADEIGCFGSQAQAETLFYLILQREKAKHAVA